MAEHADKRWLFVPHADLSGGAGLYNRAFLRVLSQETECLVAGPFSKHYPAYETAAFPAFLLGRWSQVACYAGVRPPGRAVAVIQALVLAAVLSLASPFLLRDVERWNVVCFSSSIQLLLAWATKRAKPGIKVCILIQENMMTESRLFGALLAPMLRHLDAVVCISKSWQERAQRHGIAAILVENPAELKRGAPHVRPAQSDLLFVGGDSALKGFGTAIAVFLAVARRRSVTLTVLGTLSERARAMIAAANAACGPASRILAVGHVQDIFPYLERSRLLLLPIAQPHFWRPAIEAGFAKRTYVVTRFEDNRDFGVENRTCVSAPGADAQAWARATIDLLNNPSRLHALEAASHRYAVDNFSTTIFETRVRALAATLGGFRVKTDEHTGVCR